MVTTARELYDLDPEEISLVDRGANKRKILVRKRDAGGSVGKSERIQKAQDTLTPDKPTPEGHMAEQQIKKVDFTDDEKTAVAAVMTMLGGGDAASDEEKALAAKVLGKAQDFGGLYPKPEERIENAEHEDEELEMAKRKDLPEEVRKALAEGEAKRLVLEKRLDEETDRRLTTEHIQKARGWTNLGKPEDVGPILKSIHDVVTDEEWTFLEGRFDASEEVLKTSGLFKEIGSGGEGGEGDAANKLNVIAKRLHDDGKAETFAKSYDLAMTQNPELVHEINNSTSTRGN